jgi:DNA-binding phage protein
MPKTLNNPINKRIVELIGNEYGAVKQFAAKAGLNYDLLRKKICLDSTPSLSTLIAISRAYGVSLDDLCKDYQPEGWFKL